MKSVLYLCRGDENSDDFYFAPELPEGYFAPGLFLVEAKDSRGKLHGAYTFAARQGTQVLNLELRSTEGGRTFIVDAGLNGKFYFNAVSMTRKTRYGGSRVKPFEGFPFFRLDPANMQHLEQACQRNDFYFIGSAGD